jgi:anti-sigma factor RsiW
LTAAERDGGSADDLVCQQVVELVTEYLEEALSPADRARFEAHLAACAGCRTYLEQIHRTIRVVGDAPAAPLEPAVRQELLRLFRGWTGEGQR